MVIEFERTLEDMIQFNLFHYAHSPTIQREMWINRVLAALLVITLSLGLIYLIDHSLSLFAYIVSIFGGVVIFIGLPYLMRASTIRRLRRVLNEGENNAVLGHLSISLSPEGIFSKSSNSEGKLNWSTVQKTVENDKYIFMYISATNAIVIPKKAFATDKSRQEFLDYVSANVKG